MGNQMLFIDPAVKPCSVQWPSTLIPKIAQQFNLYFLMILMYLEKNVYATYTVSLVLHPILANEIDQSS